MGIADQTIEPWDRAQSIQGAALLFRQAGELAHASSSALSAARQKPIVRALSSGCPTSLKNLWIPPHPIGGDEPANLGDPPTLEDARDDVVGAPLRIELGGIDVPKDPAVEDRDLGHVERLQRSQRGVEIKKAASDDRASALRAIEG